MTPAKKINFLQSAFLKEVAHYFSLKFRKSEERMLANGINIGYLLVKHTNIIHLFNNVKSIELPSNKPN